MNIKALFISLGAAAINLLGALSCGMGGGRDILPIDPDIDLHMAAVERSFEKVYTSFTMLRQDYNEHLSMHFESREVQYDSLGEEIVDTTPPPSVIDCPFTAYCGLDNVTYAPPSNKMPISQRIALLDEKLGYLTGCVKKYAELYHGHLEACHGVRKRNEPRLSYRHLSDELARPTAVRILDSEVRELDNLVAWLIKDFNEHMNGHL
jgi:hypothetical protein